MKVHVIAEAGSNHNGSLELAFALNRVARDAEADSVKYQIIYTDGLYRPGDYAYGHYDMKEVRRIRDEGAMTKAEWTEINNDAVALGIAFSASVFDTRGLQLLKKLSPPYVKIASCDLNNIRFLREVAEVGLPMIVSTGMSSLADIEKTVAALDRSGVGGQNLVLLHCVSAYPSKLEHTNLAFLATLRSAFGTAVGFSDHTITSEAACVAVALGATWIEKHFTTSCKLDGFDHKYALEPEGLKDYVASIRAVEQSMTPKVVKIGEAEAYTRQRARRGIYTARDLSAGTVLTHDDLLVVRPESQIPADEVDELVGMRLKEAVSAFMPLEYGLIQPVD